MARFVATLNFTEQGIRNVGDTTKRAEAFRNVASGMDVEVSEIYWTMGSFDGLIIFDAPDDETASALMLKLGSLGNVRTQTTRAYTAAETDRMLSRAQA